MDTLANKEWNTMIETAITILKRGEPLPVDLIASLLEEGIDVSELERKYFS